jgi:hypothetical protein
LGFEGSNGWCGGSLLTIFIVTSAEAGVVPGDAHAAAAECVNRVADELESGRLRHQPEHPGPLRGGQVQSGEQASKVLAEHDGGQRRCGPEGDTEPGQIIEHRLRTGRHLRQIGGLQGARASLRLSDRAWRQPPLTPLMRCPQSCCSSLVTAAVTRLSADQTI